jgi:hypothetical protein
MSSTGAFLAALNGEKLNIVAGCLTFYLVATAYLVVHPLKKNDRLYNTLLMVFGLMVAYISDTHSLHRRQRYRARICGTS